MASNQLERFSAILGQLESDGTTTVDGLAKLLNVSSATVRRDLQKLQDHRLLARTHGGAVAQAVAYELPVRYRAGRHSAEKKRIGAAAAALIADGAVVGITGGTTTTEAARALAGRSDLTILTNALNIAAELAVRPNLRLVVTGGITRSASFELVGPITEHVLGQYNLDVALVGADGVDVATGCSTHDPIEARSNALLVERSQQTIVLADSTKLGRTAFATICPLTAVDVLITDTGAPESTVQKIRDVGIEVHVV
ncbi:MAG TPA: DeoR/GlpR family DNA-binding transcription regulator [Acidimicrobiales bacterium]|nr:DeoR/GlpR family DNA-binding transcription regulator [Acidimicrobiales bacterium]